MGAVGLVGCAPSDDDDWDWDTNSVVDDGPGSDEPDDDDDDDDDDDTGPGESDGGPIGECADFDYADGICEPPQTSGTSIYAIWSPVASSSGSFDLECTVASATTSEVGTSVSLDCPDQLNFEVAADGLTGLDLAPNDTVQVVADIVEEMEFVSGIMYQIAVYDEAGLVVALSATEVLFDFAFEPFVVDALDPVLCTYEGDPNINDDCARAPVPIEIGLDDQSEVLMPGGHAVFSDTAGAVYDAYASNTRILCGCTGSWAGPDQLGLLIARRPIE